MSITAMKYVWDHSKTQGSARVLMLALADMANDDGECWPGKANLAQRVNVKPKQIGRLIQICEQLGELRVVERYDNEAKRNLSNVYLIVGVATYANKSTRPIKPKQGKMSLAPHRGVLPQKGVGGSPLEGSRVVPYKGPKTKDNPNTVTQSIVPIGTLADDKSSSDAVTVSVENNSTKTPKTSKVREPRKRNELFDAVAREFFYIHDLNADAVKKAASSINSVVASLRAVDPEVSPASIAEFIAAWDRKRDRAGKPLSRPKFAKIAPCYGEWLRERPAPLPEPVTNYPSIMDDIGGMFSDD